MDTTGQIKIGVGFYFKTSMCFSASGHGSCHGMASAALDCETVSLHSTNGRQMPAIRAVQGDCQWPLKTVEIPISQVSSYSIVTEAIPIYILTNQSHQPIGGYVSYPLTDLLPPGYDCVTVSPVQHDEAGQPSMQAALTATQSCHSLAWQPITAAVTWAAGPGYICRAVTSLAGCLGGGRGLAQGPMASRTKAQGQQNQIFGCFRKYNCCHNTHFEWIVEHKMSTQNLYYEQVIKQQFHRFIG